MSFVSREMVHSAVREEQVQLFYEDIQCVFHASYTMYISLELVPKGFYLSFLRYLGLPERGFHYRSHQYSTIVNCRQLEIGN